MKKIAILASGSGTNAEQLIGFFRTHPSARVVHVLCNKPGAGVIDRAKALNVPVMVFNREKFTSGEVLDWMREGEIDLVVLAGFLWLVPPAITEAFEGRIVNIHPALLPKYGGKGMYGKHVHEAVIASGDKESGITIHYVNDAYDEGDTIFQAICPVEPGDSADDLATRIHSLEHAHYPKVVEKLVEQL